MNTDTARIDWERSDGVTYASPSGRIDTTNANEFQAALEAGLRPDDVKLALDFEAVNFISSAGLRVIIAVAKQFRKKEAQIALYSFTSSALNVITISGIDRALDVYSSRAQAVNSLRG